MPAGLITKVRLAAAVLLVSAGCHRGPERAPPIAVAFAGPPQLKIRSDIATQSPTVATARHGERLEILGRRRSFFRVRTPGGAEGWTDQRQLLAASDMAALKALAERAAKMPSQGQATPYHGDLRVHILPSRQAPGFLVIKEGEKVDVLTHVAAPRAEIARPPLIPPKPKKPKDAARKNAKEPRYPPPPLPKPPGPPEDWLDLSKTEAIEEDEAPAAEEPQPKPVALDDWSLVRTSAGESGWVLTSPLRMAIPDEVAQYAEGHRIVSYFSLGEVRDGDDKKNIWLWTTISGGLRPYDFDSFRVFVWSLRHHRYETAHIERNLQGYEPVLLTGVDYPAAGKSKDAAAEKVPGFSICVEKSDGRHRREYALLGNLVRPAGERACEAPEPPPNLKPSDLAPGLETSSGQAAPQPKQPQGETWGQRIAKRVKGWFGR